MPDQPIVLTKRFLRQWHKMADPAYSAIGRTIDKLRDGTVPMKALLAHPHLYELRPLARLRLIVEQADGGWIIRSVGDHDPVLRRP